MPENRMKEENKKKSDQSILKSNIESHIRASIHCISKKFSKNSNPKKDDSFHFYSWFGFEFCVPKNKTKAKKQKQKQKSKIQTTDNNIYEKKKKKK